MYQRYIISIINTIVTKATGKTVSSIVQCIINIKKLSGENQTVKTMKLKMKKP